MYLEYRHSECVNYRVKQGNFGQPVNWDMRKQTMKIQMTRLIKSPLIRIFTLCLI